MKNIILAITLFSSYEIYARENDKSKILSTGEKLAFFLYKYIPSILNAPQQCELGGQKTLVFNMCCSILLCPKTPSLCCTCLCITEICICDKLADFAFIVEKEPKLQ